LSNEAVIRVDGLSKRYRLGAPQERYRTLRDTFARTMARSWRNGRTVSGEAGAAQRTADRTLWALHDLSFEVARGEVVGIIGRNGAGKSTLLKILSRITEPTTGYAEIWGRVGSLLEVGTGFHQELTGRENIYLNGAILGMRRTEIDRKFDEIVTFAEVDRFIDTQVKHYSSGMYLRLAFSVAAHLETDILLVDEVLAVGDIGFQQKCLGKMEDAASQGRTVLFVSHNLSAIRDLCQSSIVLSNGELAYRGSIIEGLAHYAQSFQREGTSTWGDRSGWQLIQVSGASSGTTAIAGGEPILAEAMLSLADDCILGRFFCIFENAAGSTVIHQQIRLDKLDLDELKAGQYQVRVELAPLWLAPGVYTAYFKFMGQSRTGSDEYLISERTLLEVSGSIDGVGRALLAPPAQWRLTRSGSTDWMKEASGHPVEKADTDVVGIGTGSAG
jgi:lipopolysaccharide transport system ATP-binding protein